MATPLAPLLAKVLKPIATPLTEVIEVWRPTAVLLTARAELSAPSAVAPIAVALLPVPSAVLRLPLAMVCAPMATALAPLALAEPSTRHWSIAGPLLQTRHSALPPTSTDCANAAVADNSMLNATTSAHRCGARMTALPCAPALSPDANSEATTHWPNVWFQTLR